MEPELLVELELLVVEQELVLLLEPD